MLDKFRVTATVCNRCHNFNKALLSTSTAGCGLVHQQKNSKTFVRKVEWCAGTTVRLVTTCKNISTLKRLSMKLENDLTVMRMLGI